MTEDMQRWKGRTALVTGASSGIGRAVALQLAKDGMTVVACARRAGRLEELTAEAASFGATIRPMAVDLRREAAILEMFSAIRDLHGGVDVMVNNAGLGFDEPLMSGDTERWREILEVNVLALCVCTREAVADMRAGRDDGHVIHVGSMAGHRVPRSSGVYSASKYAVRSLTESLRLELRKAGSGIRVSAISPGFVQTEFSERYNDSSEVGQATYGQFKCLTAEDVARAVRFVVSSPPHVQFHDLLVRPTQQPS